LETKGPKQPTTLDTVGNVKNLGLMLGCMFAPNNPDCEKYRNKKSDDNPHQTQDEYLKEVDESFEKFDENS
jgi:hypothetical protein